MATSAAGWPVMRHVCGPGGWSKGKQRRVACVSSFTRPSSASLPPHPPRAHLPAAHTAAATASGAGMTHSSDQAAALLSTLQQQQRFAAGPTTSNATRSQKRDDVQCMAARAIVITKVHTGCSHTQPPAHLMQSPPSAPHSSSRPLCWRHGKRRPQPATRPGARSGNIGPD